MPGQQVTERASCVALFGRWDMRGLASPGFTSCPGEVRLAQCRTRISPRQSDAFGAAGVHIAVAGVGGSLRTACTARPTVVHTQRRETLDRVLIPYSGVSRALLHLWSKIEPRRYLRAAAPGL